MHSHQPNPPPRDTPSSSALAAGTVSAFSPHTPISTTSSSSNNFDHRDNSNPSASTPTSASNPLLNPSAVTPHTITDHDDTSHHPPGTDPNKKPRACESCRHLKVRCDPNPNGPDIPCKRCLKAKRECVVTEPTRKKQKKTDCRVTELERKIDVLTACLHARGGALVGGEQASGEGRDGGMGAGGDRWGRESPVGGMGGRDEEVGRYPPPLLPPPSSGPVTVPVGVPAPTGVAGQKRKLGEMRELDEAISTAATRDAASLSSSVTPQPGQESAKEQQPADIVDQGLITMAFANQLFTRYTTKMAIHLPGVVFPPTMTAAGLRASKPILFLSVMAAASSEVPNLQRVLNKELMQVLADRIIVRGNKSLELVQALQVAVIWYWPPERFEELKFYQLVHVAAIMAIELGLGRKKAARGGFRKHISQAWRDHPLRKRPPPDPTTVEARRAWLTCYFMATNTAMALHRPNLIRWTPFMAECLEFLQTSPEAAPTDKYLCHLIWTHKLAEEVSVQFSMDDSASTPNLADFRTQYVLKGFELQLERYRAAVPRDMLQPSLKMSFHVISLYMHEIATHSDSSDDCKLQPSEHMLGPEGTLTTAHINALSACLTAIDGIFEVFLSLDVHTIRCLAVFNFVRVAYAVVVLIKIYFAASSPKSDLGKVLNKDDMKVEQHLENLLAKFRETAAEDKSRPAAKFLIVLVMLRSWFHKQKQSQSSGGQNASGNPTATDTPPNPPRPSFGKKGSATPAPQHPQQQAYPTAQSTPLHVLSEIAANDSAAASTASMAPRPSTATDLLPPPHPTTTTSSIPSTSPWMTRPSLPNLYDPATTPTSQQAPPHTTPEAPPPATSTNTVPSAAANAYILPQPLNLPFDWENDPLLSSMDFDYDYANLGGGFEQAMDMTLGGFMEHGFGGDMMAPPPHQDTTAAGSAGLGSGWGYPPMGMGVGVNSMGVQGGTPSGGYRFGA
ncbi:hypothetical protein VTI74DRAFT_943 [Chaetomium olivicolor]